MSNSEYLEVWYQAFGATEWGVDCGRQLIRLSDYGKATRYGWDIDHIVPTALGGADNLANKRPRQYQRNRADGPAIARLANALASPAISRPTESGHSALANALASPAVPRPTESGHSALANALASPAMPLTAESGHSALANALARPRGLF